MIWQFTGGTGNGTDLTNFIGKANPIHCELNSSSVCQGDAHLIQVAIDYSPFNLFIPHHEGHGSA
jgi:hypothetical protein